MGPRAGKTLRGASADTRARADHRRPFELWMRRKDDPRGGCEFCSKDVAVTDPAILRALLKVKPGLMPGYQWVEWGACASAWQVPYYAAESVG